MASVLLRLPVVLVSAFSLNFPSESVAWQTQGHERRLASGCDADCTAGLINCDASCDVDCMACSSVSLCGSTSSCTRDGEPTEGCTICPPPAPPPDIPPPAAPADWIDNNPWFAYVIGVPLLLCMLGYLAKCVCGVSLCGPCGLCNACPGFSATGGSNGVELNFT